jgi:hypothetical protein
MWAILTAIPGAIGSLLGLAEKGIDYYIKRADGDVQKALALMQADQARIAAQRDITVAGMSHPIWWTGWAMFVFPLGIYWSKILVWDKVLAWGTTDRLEGFVLEWAGWIVGGLFCLQVGTGIAGAIINRVVKR